MRVLVLAPTGRDSALICDLLDRRSIACQPCSSGDDVCSQIQSGAGAAIIAEEALDVNLVRDLTVVINAQPTWSDFPLVMLTSAGQVTTSSQRRRSLREPLGNVLLLERPLRPETLISTIENSLRARRRQYQIREQLEQFHAAQEALRRSEKLAVTGRLAASIAHEVNNPLEAVTNLLYLIRHSDPNPEIVNFLNTADQELARVAEITKQTLRFYREQTHPIPTDLPALIRAVLVLFTPRFHATGITVETEFTAVPHLLAVPGELRQLFVNLTGNALDALRSGGSFHVRLRPAHHPATDAPGIRISIADTGAGIPPEVRSKIFEPFVTTKPDTGTGLGLWVASEIISKHAGTIQVRSCTEPTRSGTVFSIFLPLGNIPTD